MKHKRKFNSIIFVLNMDKQNVTWYRGRGTIFVHILIWSIVIAMPVIFVQREGTFHWSDFLRFMPVFVSFLVVFYVNYLYLVDSLLFKRETMKFIIVNILMIVGIALLLHLWHEIEFTLNLVPAAEQGPARNLPPKRPALAFIIRDIFSLTFVSVLGIVMKSTERIAQMQSRQKELEKAMVEAELKNLKNQINPHFLLNTLNNIYALSRMNSPKTADSIMELSELLRYLLYKDDKTFVPLKEEAAFLANYIDLMKLRLTDNVKITTRIDIPGDSRAEIAPLIYISLIENAFKHGVSNDDPSFVQIELSENEDGQVHFLCKNSFFPKNESDRSGSGIGLQQVRKRLDLLYPYRYMWHKEIEGNVYSSVLIINTLEENETDS